jgi:hypothetical protein
VFALRSRSGNNLPSVFIPIFLAEIPGFTNCLTSIGQQKTGIYLTIPEKIRDPDDVWDEIRSQELEY